ncbi:MAG: ImmA/IrrE family metallo-endopeptidase [Coprobacillaceae bacterium]
MTDQEIQQICDDYNICYIVGNLPNASKAFTFQYGDKYLVVVSNKCSATQQRKSLLHELAHITEGHFEKSFEEVMDVEKDARQLANDMHE